MFKSASSVANMNNADANAKQTDLSKELTDQMVIQKNLDANVEAVKTQDKMLGSLLDLTI
ncbi:MAG: hypothetical protein J0647_08345 [Campylobacteraceae bacterium]|nr:hypothetical protein [Campylobacteraceae bacterium]